MENGMVDFGFKILFSQILEVGDLKKSAIFFAKN